MDPDPNAYDESYRNPVSQTPVRGEVQHCNVVSLPARMHGGRNVQFHSYMRAAVFMPHGHFLLFTRSYSDQY